MSKIEWTETTWNPLAGCTRVSPGCDNCYAASMALRLEAMGQAKYQDVATRNKKGVAVFTGKINLDYNMLERPLSWRKPRLVFVNSMSDLFHHNVTDDFIMAVFDVMKRTPRHTYQVLTKRPERMASWQRKYMPDGLPANVWAGTSVENQSVVDDRLKSLMWVKANTRFLSCEPLLGHVDVSLYLDLIHWVIAGGESGHNARPMHHDWARSLRDQCQEAGVPFFFKQWGKYIPESQLLGMAHQPWMRNKHNVIFIDSLSGMFYEVGKGKAGRILDGRTWDEMPEVANE